MTSSDWNRLRDLFHAAVDLDLPSRERLLESLDQQDSAIRAELSSLLAEQPVQGFLEEGPSIPQLPRPRFERLGPYRVVREIGHGGMGVVFEAVREEDGISQTVAVKVLRAAVFDQGQERLFRRERQALSALDHPNIARMIDWGETAEGRAFLVIEYVRDARPIDAYCAARNLSPRALIELFLQVCDAVAHAHRHLIVHSDLKPANVLVTDEGHVKLLDFGIAKLLDPSGDRTATFAVRMTPAYASPEQARGGVVRRFPMCTRWE